MILIGDRCFFCYSLKHICIPREYDADIIVCVQIPDRFCHCEGDARFRSTISTNSPFIISAMTGIDHHCISSAKRNIADQRNSYPFGF
jgi:hypothetical protein